MATTVSYTASMRTQKNSSASNCKGPVASQEFYMKDCNSVGIVHFCGLSLLNKVITGIMLRVTSAEAGYAAGTAKAVYLRKSKYQQPPNRARPAATIAAMRWGRLPAASVFPYLAKRGWM